MSYSSEILADSPIAWWRLNTLSGTESDQGSGGHTLTYVGGPTRQATGLISGDSDTCVGLLNADEYCSTPDAVDLIFTTPPFTVELLYKPTSLPTSGNIGALVSKGSAGNGGWSVLIFSIPANLRMTFYKGVNVDIISSLALAVGTIYHIVVVWRASGNTDFYVNNTKQNKTTAGTPDTNSQIAVVGALSSAGGTQSRGYFDEVAIYNTALSDARVQEHYNAAFAPDELANTIFRIGRGSAW